ncbi:hypothetical protein I2I11_18840 [Pontibacter sp. 172403-2]|uniref:hypothetical protein n=1 Tax=Pontibacter rufus TaxID=2791028 RepID=UPI0018AFB9F3|nr:hypothetical protein [Pontibacter sp. 172403-2]MBF9255362.1 hypothetical protein [Pontibacter sp. 172403-2]
MKVAKILFFLFVVLMGGVMSWYGYEAVKQQPLSSVLFFGGFVVVFAGVIGIFVIASRK